MTYKPVKASSVAYVSDDLRTSEDLLIVNLCMVYALVLFSDK